MYKTFSAGALLALFTLVLVFTAGCVEQPAAFPENLEPAPATTGQNAAPAVEQETPDTGVGNGTVGNGTASAEENAATLSDAADKPSVPVEDEDTELLVAQAGVRKKGQYGETGGPADFVTVPIASLWAVQAKAAFQIKVPHALQLYKASNDGKLPADFEEFKREILDKEMIELPELRDGEEYVYDPTAVSELEMLKVRRPRKR